MKNVMKVICIVLLLATVGVQAELLVNPGFEDGPLGQTGLTDWVETGVNIPGWYYWGYDGLANMGWVHDLEGRVQDTQGICLAWDTTLILQEFGHGTLVEGQQYDFSVDVRDSTVNTLDDADGWNGFMTAEIWDYVDGVWTNVGASTVEYDYATDPEDEWVTLATSLTAPAGSEFMFGKIYFGLKFIGPAFAGTLDFDNASVTPEPMTLGLLGLGGLFLRRRR